jgi:hypothetical protein
MSGVQYAEDPVRPLPARSPTTHQSGGWASMLVVTGARARGLGRCYRSRHHFGGCRPSQVARQELDS